MDDETQKKEVNPGYIIGGVVGSMLLIIIIIALLHRLVRKPVPQVVRSIRAANSQLHPTAAISPRLLETDEFMPEMGYFEELSGHNAVLRRDAMYERRLRDQELAEKSSRPRYATDL